MSSSYNAGDLNMFATSMQEFETLTCVRFVPRTVESNYLNIVPGAGCSSFVGRNGGGQTVSLGGGCIFRGTIQHELNHALGFYHEHMRSDRDSYVDIMFQYIDRGYWGNFAKLNTNNLGIEYDYASVMHYDGYEFSNTTNQPSIVPKPDPNVPIGQRDGLSILDVSKINKLYQCSVCATLLNQPNGTFTSANYPSAYPDNVNCVWLIRTPYGQASLSFNGFDVQSTPDCSSDYMRIYDGPSKKSPVLLDKTCGSQSIPQIIASSSQMLVEFVSDGGIAGVGFTATYSPVQCGGTYFNSQGTFSSPGYPNSYWPNMNCNYTITAPVGKKITLTITDFHLEYVKFCYYDYVNIYADNIRRVPFCGDRTIPVISSQSNTILVTFHSDAYTQAKGFQASYIFYENTLSMFKKMQENSQSATKSEDSEVPQGTFSKILHANKDIDMYMDGGDMLVKNKHNNTNCSPCLWPINVDGTVSVPYTISVNYSADDLNKIATAMAEFETLTCVRFVPHTAEKEYIKIVPGAGCSSFVGINGGAQTVSLGGGCIYRGTIQHELNHALGFYHEHMRSDRDSYVDIMFQYIDREYWGNFAKLDNDVEGLEYDYGSVMHYDGYEFSNTSNQPSIVPKPDPNVPIGQRDGLSILDVSKINRLYQCSVCATLLNQQNGTFTSANYPSAYPDNVNCVWLIRTPYGQASLTFNGFDVQSTPDCSSDYMRIYDGPSKNSSVLLDKTCGSQSIPQIIASTSQMLVEFVSDGGIAGVGFKATYSPVRCGGTYFNSQGTFSSPGYPNSYWPNLDCNYTITAPVGKKIALTVTDFHLEYVKFCHYDYVNIYADNIQRVPFCGERTVPQISSQSNTILVTFHSDAYTQAKGFQASYIFCE
ncbi:embryonic protein UVS.2-like [Mantella aurantiaca]